MTIIVRHGTAEDIPAIMPVMHNAFDPEFGEAWNSGQCLGIMVMPGATLLLAHDQNNKVYGFAIARTVFEETELLLLATDPEQRRKGIASALMQSLFDTLSTQKKHKIYLEMRDGNTAQYFYKNLGFSQIGVRPNYYNGINGAKFDALTLGKEL